TPVKDAHDLPAMVAATPVGGQGEVTVLRNGQEKTLTVKIGELGEQQAKAESGEGGGDWGITVANLSSGAARRFQLGREQKGVVVTEVEPGSPAEGAGLQPGDVIQEVNRQPIESVADFRKAVANAKEEDTLLLLVRR